MRILTSTAEIIQRFKQAVARLFNSRLPRGTARAQEQIRQFTSTFFRGSETYRSLVDGGLQGSFGFPSGQERAFADWFVATIANNILVKSDIMRANSGKFFGSVHVLLPYDTYKQLYTGFYSRVPIESGSIPWVEWLLQRGDDILIEGYHVAFTDTAESRTGIAVMGKGGSWKIPAKYSGTENDNWITRTMVESKDYITGITQILEKELLR